MLSSCCPGPPHWCRWRCRCAWWWPRRCAAWGGWMRRRRTLKCWQVGSPTARHRRLDRLLGTGPGWFGHSNPCSITCPQLLLSLAVSQTHCPLLPGWVTEGEAAFGEMSGSAPVSIHQQALRGIALVRALDAAAACLLAGLPSSMAAAAWLFPAACDQPPWLHPTFCPSRLIAPGGAGAR